MAEHVSQRAPTASARALTCSRASGSVASVGVATQGRPWNNAG
ncbi:hypothetical protein AAF143_03600 [Cyanobium sp. ATX-6F1]